jgi:hypothetical protein
MILICGVETTSTQSVNVPIKLIYEMEGAGGALDKPYHFIKKRDQIIITTGPFWSI